MTEHDRMMIEAARRLYGGQDSEFATIAPDIVWHVPGRNPVSGEYRGYEQYTQAMPARMAPLTRWDFELEDVMVNGDMVVTTWRVVGERRGKAIDLRGAHILRINAHGQVVEGWGLANDQDALDDFFAS
jgi:ketosteroid isomerase-like protein